MKLILSISIIILTTYSCSSQDVSHDELIGKWKEGQSMLNGVPDTISRFAEYHTGEKGYIYQFSKKNKMTIWDFGPKGRFGKRKTTWKLDQENNMPIIEVSSGRYLIITKLTKNELWITYPEAGNIEKCSTFKRIK